MSGDKNTCTVVRNKNCSWVYFFVLLLYILYLMLLIYSDHVATWNNKQTHFHCLIFKNGVCWTWYRDVSHHIVILNKLVDQTVADNFRNKISFSWIHYTVVEGSGSTGSINQSSHWIIMPQREVWTIGYPATSAKEKPYNGHLWSFVTW